jgi:Ser-tRNA(Ala) deacylase AlaX
MTDRLYLVDADLRTFDATVVSVDGDRVELDRTAFYATSVSGSLCWMKYPG